MYCPNCGANSQPGAAFCATCGGRLPQETVFRTPEKGISKLLPIIIAAAVLVAAVIAGVAIWQGTNSGHRGGGGGGGGSAVFDDDAFAGDRPGTGNGAASPFHSYFVPIRDYYRSFTEGDYDLYLSVFPEPIRTHEASWLRDLANIKDAEGFSRYFENTRYSVRELHAQALTEDEVPTIAWYVKDICFLPGSLENVTEAYVVHYEVTQYLEDGEVVDEDFAVVYKKDDTWYMDSHNSTVTKTKTGREFFKEYDK